LLVMPLAAQVYTPAAGVSVDARRIAVDNGGFLWVSGERGIFRFDGVRYLAGERFGLPNEGAGHIAITSDGTVWAQARNHLWRLDGDRFTMVDERTIITPVEAAGTLLYSNPGPVRVWYREGGLWRFAEGPRVPMNLRLHGQSDGTVWLSGRGKQGTPSTVLALRFDGRKFVEKEVSLGRVLPPQREVAAAGDGALFTGGATGVYRFERKRGGPFQLASEYTSTAPVPSRRLAGADGEVWYEGCGKWLSSAGRSVGFPGVLEVTPDSGGGLWAALGEKGLAYSAAKPIHGYSLRGLPDRPVTSAARLGSKVYVSRHDSIAVIDEARPNTRCDGTRDVEPSIERWGPSAEDAPFFDVLPDPDGTVWLLARTRGIMHHDAAGKFLGTADPYFRVQVSQVAMRRLALTDDGRLWIAAKANFIELFRKPELAYHTRYPGVLYVSGFTRDRAGRLMAISDRGLLRYEKGNWLEDPLPPCLLSGKPRAAAIAPGDEYWFGYRDVPGVTAATRTAGGWSCRHYGKENGFPGDTQFLEVDSGGRLFRGSNEGVFVRRESGSWDRVVAPAGEMHQLFQEQPDGSFLLAMGDRLLRIPRRLTESDPGVAPVISYVESGGGISLRPAEVSISLGDDTSVHFSALPERELGAPAPLEYRFDERPWQPVVHHSVSLAAAPRGASRVEVRYGGSAKVTSLPLRITIPWWRSHWTWGACGLALSALAPFAYGRLQRWRYEAGKRKYLAARTHPAVPEGAIQAGTLLQGRYRIEGLIANGGFSQVFGAVDETTGARVVVKRLRAGDMRPERLRRRFAQEVAAASIVRHPGIVPIIDSWIDENYVPHLAMPRVDGPTLRGRLRAGGFAREAAIAFLEGLADILAAAHARGVVHSDLKPENILLDNDKPLLIDFGTSALHMTSGLSEYTHPAGSVHYMAPEQVLGRYSKATDVYAFALVALEVLTGVRYTEIDLPMNDRWEGALRQALAELHLNPQTAGVFADALRFDPEMRAGDVAVWMSRLREALGGS